MNSPRIINLPKISDSRGNLSFIEGLEHIPFEIKRAYWIYDVPGGETRGGHAFKEQDEFIIAMSGSFDVKVIQQDGTIQNFSLNRSYFGLYIPAGSWRQMHNFSTNSIALVLASTKFNNKDYIRDFEGFKNYTLDIVRSNKLSNNQNFRLDKIYPNKTTVDDCQFIELDKNHRDKGNITVVENGEEVSFDINRVYYLYDVPGGEERGGHAHKELYQLLVATGGSFDVELYDGKNRSTVTLNRPYQGLKIVPGIWRELKNFSSGSCCLVLASHAYNEQDYIRDYSEFEKTKKVGG